MLTQNELREMAQLHGLWLEGNPDGHFADFAGMELAGLDFSGIDFEVASFRNAWIHDCNLCGHFVGANFRGAELRDIYAGHSCFEAADFTDATCCYCDFSCAKFDGAHLRRATFNSSNFSFTNLEFCDMTGIKLESVTYLCTATAGSWGRTPPARDAETLAAEEKFAAAMLGLGFGGEWKISEWRDEAWSQAQDHTGNCEPKPGPREAEYRALLTEYASAFAQARAQFPSAAGTLFSQGEGFLPEELPVAAEYIAEGGSLEVAQRMEWDGLYRQEADKIAALSTLKRAVDSTIAEALLAADNSEILLDLGEIMTAYGIDTLYEVSFFDMLRERGEVASARLDLNEDTITLEMNPGVVSGMTMQMQ